MKNILTLKAVPIILLFVGCSSVALGLNELLKYEKVEELVKASSIPDNSRTIYLLENIKPKEKALEHAIDFMKSSNGLYKNRNEMAERLVSSSKIHIFSFLFLAALFSLSCVVWFIREKSFKKMVSTKSLKSGTPKSGAPYLNR